MVFSSAFFLFAFLPFCLIVNALLAATRNIPAQNIFLLLVSLFFYTFGEMFYALVMIFSIMMNYVFGLFIKTGGVAEYYLGSAWRPTCSFWATTSISTFWSTI